MTPTELGILAAVRDNLRKREAVVNARIEQLGSDVLKAVEDKLPQVHNHLPAPEVNVLNQQAPAQVEVRLDLLPLAEIIATAVAAAVDRLNASLREQLAGMEEMHAQLLRVLAEQPRPVTRVTVPENAVQLQLPERPKRRIKIAHGDGTESVVTEL